MKKSISIFLVVVFLFSCPVSSFADVDPVVGGWCAFKMTDESHALYSLYFYPDGVMWEHFLYVENDILKSNTAKELHWKRDEYGNLIVDSRNKKKSAYFAGNDVLSVVNDETAIIYTRIPDPDDVLFLHTVSIADASFELSKWKGYVVGEDIPAGYYVLYCPFEIGRLYFYSSVENFQNDYSMKTEMIGTSVDKKYEYGLDLKVGQVIKVNQSDCTIYHIEQ